MGGWEGGEDGKVVRLQSGKGGRVVKWQGGKGVRMVSQEGGSTSFYFKGGGHKMSPRFQFFVFYVNQGNERVGWVQGFLVWPQEWKDSP